MSFWFSPLFLISFSFCLSLLLCFATLHFFPRIGLLDRPEKYGYKRSPIPYPGGVAPICAFLVSILLFFPKLNVSLLFFCGAVSCIALVSFWDDRRHLPSAFRLLIHFCAAGMVVFSGVSIEYLGNPFGETLFLRDAFFWLPEIITMLWIVGFANILNWLDGVPGLSSASAASAGSFLGWLSLTPLVSQTEIALLSFVFAASAFGFFLFNIPPPKMLLGDTGAMSYGFIIATLSVFSGGKMATILLVLAIPFFDALFVILRRLLSKKNPLQGGDELHLHDRLRKAGFSDRMILLFFFLPSVFLGWASLQLETFGKILLLGGIIIGYLIISLLLDTSLRQKNPLSFHSS